MNVVVDTRVSVYLGSNYYNEKVEGLCGNYNGKSSDDFGADTSIASSLVDQASIFKTTSACPEGEMELNEEPCKVRFSETPPLPFAPPSKQHMSNDYCLDDKMEVISGLCYND